MHTQHTLAKSQVLIVYCVSYEVLVIQRWSEIIGQARQSVKVLKDQEVIRTVLNILQTNCQLSWNISLNPDFIDLFRHA
ncbi:hypothetical protein RchiOBHm_Chr4g0407411 [Rosa chinensis]|uniref:Uncharacterized protein n=1 Tax=Rosa chinensis TaxID=74649 RepID=A0A2P6QUN4_ROSCH|nr:hypothetical protein RchiOBHm_Chr4g0407411 [Rosa chinensis]